MAIADVHAHAISESLLAKLSRDRAFGFQDIGGGGYATAHYGPLDLQLYRHEARLQRLAGQGFELQVLSPLPFFLNWPGAAADSELARLVNLSTRECVEGSGGRFRGLAALPLAEPGKIIEELDRCVGEYGFVGVALGTHRGDRPLDDAAFAPLWAELERRGLLAFMHPNNAEAPGRWRDYTLNVVLAWPNETTLAVSRLIFAGILERHPRLNLVLAHGGGNLPFMGGRLDLAYHALGHERNPACRANISKPPSGYFEQIYFDTAVGGPEQLRFLIELVGTERVVFGSDDPYEIADHDGSMALPVIRTLERSQADKIESATLLRIISAAGR